MELASINTFLHTAITTLNTALLNERNPKQRKLLQRRRNYLLQMVNIIDNIKTMDEQEDM